MRIDRLQQGLPAPAFVVKGETTEAGVDFLLVDPFDVELEDNGHSAYLAAVSYALEHLSDEGVGVFIVTPDDLQEQVSLVRRATPGRGAATTSPTSPAFKARCL